MVRRYRFLGGRRRAGEKGGRADFKQSYGRGWGEGITHQKKPVLRIKIKNSHSGSESCSLCDLHRSAAAAACRFLQRAQEACKMGEGELYTFDVPFVSLPQSLSVSNNKQTMFAGGQNVPQSPTPPAPCPAGEVDPGGGF